MEIQNLTFTDGLTFTTTPSPPVITSGLQIWLSPNVPPIPNPASQNQDYWPNTAPPYVNDPAAPGSAVLLVNNYTWSPTGIIFDPKGGGSIFTIGTPVQDFTSQNAYTIEIWFNAYSNPLYSTSTIMNKYAYGAGPDGNPVQGPFKVIYDESQSIVQSGPLTPAGPPQRLCNTGPILPDTWYQLVTVYNYNSFQSGNTPAETVQAYLNTVPNGNNSLTGIGPLINDHDAYLGKDSDFTDEGWFKGSIGIIRIYNKALSRNEIIQNFASDRNTFGI